MRVRAASFAGKIVIAARNPASVLRLTLPARWADLLIAAGARPAAEGRSLPGSRENPPSPERPRVGGRRAAQRGGRGKDRLPHYSPSYWIRWLDGSRGRLDGLRGVPFIKLMPQPAGRAEQYQFQLSPYLEGLRRALDQRLAKTYSTAEANLLRLHQDISEAKVKLALAAIDAELAESRLSDFAAVDETPNSQAGNDETRFPPETLSERSRQQGRVTHAEARQAWYSATARRDFAASYIRHLQRDYRADLALTQAIGRQIVAYYSRRESIYMAALIRSHKSGHTLLVIYKALEWHPPSWLHDDPLET